MKRIISPLFALVMLAPVAAAQEAEGPSLMERGAQLFLEGLLKEVEPALEEFEGMAEELGPVLRGIAGEMGPKLAEILAQVEDWTAYEAPEILANGDIIIRRKPDHPTPKPNSETTPLPQIDL